MMGVYDIKGPQKTGITGKIKNFLGETLRRKLNGFRRRRMKKGTGTLSAIMILILKKYED
jgi:hypothetical protein